MLFDAMLFTTGVNHSLLVVVIASGVAYGTPLLYASLGELLAERSGVLNLGVEGMMLVGAVMGFWCVQRFDVGIGLSLAAGLVVAGIVGALMASIHAFLVITLRASQIVSGLALTIFAGSVGLSSYLGNDLNLADQPANHTFNPVFPSGMRSLPIVGPIIFGQNILVYISWALVVALIWYLNRTRLGLNVRAVGESPAAADAMGINVAGYRYAHTIAGGALAGIAGASFTLAITPQWVNGITGGAGWIAIALVIFAFWRPELCLVGAYFFGALQALAPELQARQINLGPTALWTNSLPYIATIVVLVAISVGNAGRRLGAPAALGQPYAREER
jgi:simple sugar transport system permease protein